MNSHRGIGARPTTRLALVLSLTVAATVSLLGCSKLLHPAKKTGFLTPFGPHFYDIDTTCSNTTPPTLVYKISIDNNFKLKHAAVTRETVAAIVGPDGEYDEDSSATHHPHNPVYKKTKKSRLDLDLGLQQGQTALIKVALADNDLTFLTDPNSFVTLRAGDQQGQAMFCHPVMSSDRRSIRFKAIYLPPPGTGLYTYGSFNLGIVVKDDDNRDTFTLPIFIDPEVKNQG